MAKSNVGKKPISEEEYTTNKVLTVFSVCLLGVLVLMILQRLLNYGSTFMIGLIVTRILLAIGIIGVVGGLVMLGISGPMAAINTAMMDFLKGLSALSLIHI